MSEIDQRLDRGVEIFRRAGDDSALLGAALLTFHGALEQFIDAELRGRPELSAEERRLLTAGRLGWPARAKLAEQAGLLSPEQTRLAIDATRVLRLRAQGYQVRTQTIPDDITPKNRLILASPGTP